MADKKFFRVRLSDKSPVEKKIVNGLTLTKKWQVKVGDIGDFGKFPNVEAQVVVKQGNEFVPANEADSGAAQGSDGGSGQPSGPAPIPAQDAAGAQTDEEPSSDLEETPPDFNGMTVEQLKTYLVAKGVAQSELRNATKSELIERAEFIWSQK